ELVKAEALHPFARLVEVDRYFDFNLNLFSFPLLRSHYLDIGGCENASLNGSWIQVAADKHVSNPALRTVLAAIGAIVLLPLGIYFLVRAVKDPMRAYASARHHWDEGTVPAH